MLRISQEALTFDDVLLIPGYSEVLPKDVVINAYFTLDQSSKIEQVFMQRHPELNLGDSGSIEGSVVLDSHNFTRPDLSVSRDSSQLASIAEEGVSA